MKGRSGALPRRRSKAHRAMNGSGPFVARDDPAPGPRTGPSQGRATQRPPGAARPLGPAAISGVDSAGGQGHGISAAAPTRGRDPRERDPRSRNPRNYGAGVSRAPGAGPAPDTGAQPPPPRDRSCQPSQDTSHGNRTRPASHPRESARLRTDVSRRPGCHVRPRSSKRTPDASAATQIPPLRHFPPHALVRRRAPPGCRASHS